MNTEKKYSKKIAAAAAEYEKNPKKLRTLSRHLRKPETRKACRICAAKLLELDPNSKDAIASLIYACAHETYSGKIRTALDLARQRCQSNENIFNRILNKAFKYLNEEETINLKGLLRH